MFVFLTDFSCILTNLMLFVSLIHSWNDELAKSRGKIYTLYNILFKITIAAEFLVFLFYWSMVSWTHIPRYVNTCSIPAICHVFNVLTHGYPTLITWLSLFLEPTHFKQKEFVWFLGFFIFYGCIYIPHSLVYRPVYPLVNFRTFWGYLFAVTAILISYGGF